MRFGFVVSSTRFLLGVDYSDRLLAFYFGPVAICFAWGDPSNNPFIGEEELQRIVNDEDKKR